MALVLLGVVLLGLVGFVLTQAVNLAGRGLAPWRQALL